MGMSLSPLRAAKALYSLARLVKDPNRLGEVFEMSDAVATPESLQPVVDRIAEDPDVARALAERHRIHVDLVSLRRLPEGTLGRVFADHMIAQGLDPAALPYLPSPDALTYFRAHLYETHDVWHVVTGFGTDWQGEIGLQGFYMAQIPGPLPALLLAVGCLRVAIYEPRASDRVFDLMTDGWRMARRARPLFGVHWDELWDVPLDEVRRRLGVEPIAAAPASGATDARRAAA